MNISSANKILYIKLGKKGEYWSECRDKSIIKLGYLSGRADMLNLMKNKQWEKISEFWAKNSGTPTQFTNQMRDFYEDDGTTLWITFEDEFLYYGFSDGGELILDEGSDDSYRKMKDGWKRTDINGEDLRVNQLSGKLTKTASYRQTICNLSEDVKKYLVRRLLCIKSESIENAVLAKQNLELSMQSLIQDLTWQDFELLVELIFVNSGWRRISTTGGVQKTIDIGLENPITGDMAFVQIKSSTNQSELEDYTNKMNLSSYSRLFYVYHTPNGLMENKDADVTLWNVSKIAQLVVSNGLTDWVIKRSS
jgi:hypothetical protein